MGYSTLGCKELDTVEQLSTHNTYYFCKLEKDLSGGFNINNISTCLPGAYF